MGRKSLTDVVLDIYRELYKNATPSADFDKLVEQASVDQRGRKVIPYMNCYLDKDKYEKIVDKWIKRYRRRGEAFTNGIKFEAYLGCGPSYSKKAENDGEEE